MSSMGAPAFTSVGQTVRQIPVEISYRIIELFSAGLYSSPNKAIEELVSNSYDAMASVAHLVLPLDLSAPDATIWVADDGQSMDVDGLIELWRIARTRKRERQDEVRPPIGKFGIGKLATYVLARQLTYVCRKSGEYLAVTMDFDRIDPDREAASHIQLDVRKLLDAEVATALAPMRELQGGSKIADWLLAKEAPASWTVVAMSSLRAIATELRMGRLRWLLSTALPMTPTFKLFLNGQEVDPALEKLEPLQTWIVGEADSSAEAFGFAHAGVDDRGPYLDIDGVGKVRGYAEIFSDLLTKGKAADMGRSHGFFVMVRGRLINLDDALFGLPALSHGSFARFRMVVAADGLDEYLTSTRESVRESVGVANFRAYLQAKFNEARSAYDNLVAKAAAEAHLPSRIGHTARSLSRRPLFNAIEAVLSGEIARLALIQVPVDLSEEQRGELRAKLTQALESETGLIQEVKMAPLGVDRYIASYDPLGLCVLVNTLHPFFANYIEDARSIEPFELLAVAEVLSEVYLIDEGAEPEMALRLVGRRDQFLRELVAARGRRGPALVAQELLDKRTSSSGLESAVADAFRSLGFEVSPIGGKGKPDGLAVAILGARAADADARDDYSFTYDAKSTGGARVSAKTIGVSTLARHRHAYKAQYAVVVAPGFEGEGDAQGALATECKKDGITPITVQDLAVLVHVARLRQLGFTRLRELFETARTPIEARSWIRARLDEPSERPPVEPLLRVIWQLSKESLDPVSVGAIATKLRDSKGIDLRHKELRELISSVRSLAPGFVSVQGDMVALEMSVDKVLAEIARQQGTMLSEEVLRKSFLDPLLEGTAQVATE